ncbi:MAG TPA: SUMF1/EgtB/PvdO family nonheme iron enzyme [Thermoanaerobaculia bacterium]|nr:SUMF1/EgtB/PvdO family nonheme iron enzyme [Thermoanaerobaculia bacterium]
MTRSTVRKVFLSSTARDLGPCREAVFRAISKFDDFKIIQMEDFGARDQAADPFCRALVAECDVFVGLIGYLYGSSPPGGSVSFTVGEYEAAVEAGIPRLLFLASDTFPQIPTLREPDDLWQRQQLFRDRVKKECVVDFFDAPDPLATKVTAALRNLEREEEKAPRRPAGPEQDLSLVTAAYLKFLEDRHRYLDFKGMGVSDRVPLRLPLLEMYVPLKARVETPKGETWERLRVAGRRPTEEEAAAIGQRVSDPQAILDLLKNTDGLVVLGDPGAGKSTFLKFLTLSLATGQGKGLAGRLPVLLPLAAYANALAAGELRLDRFLALYAEGRGFKEPLGPLLEQALQRGTALLLLDGLDEVRDPALRNTVVERVRDCFSAHRAAGNKFVLTSRIVGYREVRPAAEGLAECMLVDFEDEEIEAFVGKWTAAIERAAGGDAALAGIEAARERRELLEAVHRNPGVRSLAANPLLLTILAVMKRQGVTLPERRASLYQTYVETLLQSWNLVRSLAGRSSSDLDLGEILKVLAPLALWMHETSPGVGLVKEWDLHQELERIYRERGNGNPEKATRRFLEDVRKHAALLLDRGGRQYGFIHLTFQEYLAAVALAQKGQQEIGPVVDALAAHVGDPAWHEVSLLTIGYLGIVQKRDEAASAVVEALVTRAPGSPGEAVVLAGRAVADAGISGVTPACRQFMVSTLLPTMRADDVKARHRAAAGAVLAELGDPRFDPERWFLPREPLLGFVEVPAGPFQMGEGKERHEVTLPAFFISRYPVTVAQFRAFATHSGYTISPEALEGVGNHPVGSVTWRDAVAYCEWLTERLRDLGGAFAELRAVLPSEAEWEKAARGTDGREYPWGAEPDPDRANYDDSGIGWLSTVGCFPGGVSPYGCEEMSGNVWERTRSLGDDYPYPGPGSRREKREDLAASGPRVLRGGAFNLDASFVRCAVRYRRDPTARYWDIGFRVVLLPFSSDL